MKLLTTILLCSSLAAMCLADPDTKAAISSAAEKYVTANSAISKVRVTVEKVEGNYARAKASPADGTATDSVYVFLMKQNDAWIGLTLGTSFGPEDYQQLAIPRTLWIK